MCCSGYFSWNWPCSFFSFQLSSFSSLFQNLFHQGKGSRSISLNGHYLLLFKNPRDKLQNLTLAKQMYPGQTYFFLNQYEEAVKRPFGYLLIDLKTTTQDNCPLRKDLLPSEEGFKKYRATWMMCFLEKIFGMMKKISDTFSCKTDIWLYLSWLVLLLAFISSVFHLILVKLIIVFLCVFMITSQGYPLGFLLWSHFVCRCRLFNSHIMN